MIKNEEQVISNSLWNATANDTPDYPPLSGSDEAEVVIIGAGFTGLSAALHLAEKGIRVIVVEAETSGWGASGRNGGQANPGLKEEPDTIISRFGPEMGRKVIDLSGNAGRFVFDLIERLGIDCAATKEGWIQPYHSDTSEATVRNRVEQWSRHGGGLRLLSREETAHLLGTDVYRGAMIDDRGGNLHPLNYVLGLARAAQKAGAVIYAHTRVASLHSENGAHVLQTDRGRIKAKRVLIGTNGYTGAATPVLSHSVVPIRSVQVATDILPPEIQAQILPQGNAVSDSRRLLLYFRKDQFGRFIMGGRGNYSEQGTLKQMQALREVSEKLYPALKGVEWRYSWGGFVAMTADHYPHLNMVAPGIMAAVGYNGRGVAMATVLGKLMADWASGTRPEDLPFPVTPTKPIPFYFMRKPAVMATVAWARLRDDWEA